MNAMKDNSMTTLSARVHCGVWVKRDEAVTRVTIEEDQGRLHTSKTFQVTRPPKRPYAPNLTYFISAEAVMEEGKALRQEGFVLEMPAYPELIGLVEEDGSKPAVRKEMKEYFEEDNGKKTGDGLASLFSEFYN